MIKTGKVVETTNEGVTVFVPFSTHDYMKEYKPDVLVEFDDGNCITQLQRKKAHALIRDISLWWSCTPMEATKEITKMMFRSNEPSLHAEMFSLSDCDRTTARLYITYLIDFCVLHGVPTRDKLYEVCEDMEKYVWACLMTKTCCVCGLPHADLHHVDAIGSGRNRNHVLQIGMPALSLCRRHHMQSHTLGQQSFLDRYHLTPLPITDEIGKVYNLSNANLGG